MAKPRPEIQHETIVAAVGKRPKGATLVRVAVSLEPLQPPRSVQRRLRALVKKKRIVREASTNATVYKLPSAVVEDRVAILSPERAGTLHDNAVFVAAAELFAVA